MNPPIIPPDKKDTPDWERIEFEFRAGLLSLREIAAAHGSNHVAISRRAKKEKWDKDLTAKIKARTEAIVTKHVVTKDETEKRAVTESEVVEGNAQHIACRLIDQRKDIGGSRIFLMKLFKELELQTDNIELLERLEELLFDKDGDSDEEKQQADRKRWRCFQEAISLSGRVDTMKKLVESLKTLITLERQAYGIKDESAPDPEAGLASLIAKVNGTSIPIK